MNNTLRKIVLVFLTIVVMVALVIALFGFIHEKQAKNHGEEYREWTKQMKTFMTDEGDIRYIDQGEGKVVVLLHGVPTSSFMYRGVIARLVERGHRVIAPDMLGFGASSKPQGYEVYGFDQQAKRILALLDSLEIDSFNLVVHDMGGLVGWEMLEQQPDAIKGLVILDTILYQDGFVKQSKFSRKNPIHRIFLSLYGSQAIGPLIIKNTLLSGLHEVELTTQEQVAYWLPVTQQGQRSLVHFFTSLSDLEPALSQARDTIKNLKSRAPVTIIWGTYDPYLDVAQVPRFVEEIGLHDYWVRVLDVGHFVSEEAQTEIVNAVSTNASLSF